MNEESESPNSTPMDNTIDRAVKPNMPPIERLSDTADSGTPIAEKPEPLSDTAPTKLASWTMREVERIISNDVLKTPRTKIDQFAVGLNRKSDFRLKNLSQQLGINLRRDYLKDITSGPESKRVREFDIHSQTLRMASTNAALGSYQFQKSFVLPFMRKSLALGYQKVNLLKEIVGGIGSLEKAIVSKLETIKLNTAATAPRKQSYWKMLMTEVKAKNRSRIAQNISNWEMDNLSTTWKEKILPFMGRVYEGLTDERKQGGLNAVRRTVTGTLNSLRRKVNKFGSDDTDIDPNSRIGKIKSSAANAASKLIGGTMLAAHKISVPEKPNRFLSKVLRGPAEFAAKFNPFAAPGEGTVEIGGKEDKNDSIEVSTRYANPLVAQSRLAESFDQWREEYKSDQAKVIYHLASIDSQIGGVSIGEGGDKDQKKFVPPNPYTDVNSKQVSDIVSPETDKTPRTVTSIGDTLKKVREETVENKSGFKGPLSKILAPFFHRQVTESALTTVPTTAPKAAMAGVGLAFSGDKGPVDREFFKSQFSQLGEKVTNVSKTVDEGNHQRTRFEKLQEKWKALQDRLLGKKERKNSYEDITEREETKKKERKSLLGILGDRGKGLATGVGGNLLSGNLVGAAGAAGGELLGLAKDLAIDWLAPHAFDAAKGLAKGTGRVALGALSGIGGRSIVGRGARSLLTRMGGETLASGAGSALGGAARGIVGGGAGLAGRGAAAAGRGLLSGGGALLKTGLKVGVKAGPALAVGLAASAADDYFERNTTGGVKRAGQTASKAASWGAMGATLGSVIPGVGTLAGAGIGAAAGALAANMDLISAGFKKVGGVALDGLSFVGNKAYDAGKFMWTSLFGSKAKMDTMGRVKEKYQRSLLGNIKDSIFGNDAIYAKSGDVIKDGRKGLIPSIKGGMSKFLFGDIGKDGKYDFKTSILSQITDTVSKVLDDFKTMMYELPSKIADGLKGLGDMARSAGSSIAGGAGAAADWVEEKVGNIFKGQGTPVQDAKAIAQELIPGITVTSHRRNPGQAGNAGSKSWHVKSGAAIDVAPVPGMTFEAFKSKFTKAGYKLIEAIDETDPAMMKKTGASGPHWHIVLGERTYNNGGFNPAATANWGQALGGTKTNGTVGGGISSMINMGMNAAYGGGSGPLINNGSGFTIPNYATGNGSLGKGIQSFGPTVNYLMSKGWSRNGAIGIAVNLYGESGLDPNAFNGEGGGQGAQGIAQWRGPRIRDIESKFGKSLRSMSLQEQLDAVDWEMRSGKHVTPDRSIPNGDTNFVNAVNDATDWRSVVQQMVHRYERPGKGQQLVDATNKRINEGFQLLNRMGTETPQVPKTQQANAGSTKAAATTTKPATKPKTAPKKAEDPKWAAALSSSVSDLSSNVKALIPTAPASVAKPAKDKTPSIVNAPVTVVNSGGQGSKPGVSVSMSKTSVRSGA